jgi:argininosuccinate synthase
MIKWLIDKGYDVICFMADVGQGGENEKSREKAIKIGASKCIVADLKEKFVKEYVHAGIKAGLLYQGKYNLATALSRPLIAAEMIKTARKEKAVAVAHGCTGKGNDQVRFESTFRILAPELKVYAPVREWELTTRESEIEYARKNNIPIEQTKKKPYSIDVNLWGVSVEGGVLEDPWTEPPANTYISVLPAEKAPSKAETVTVKFVEGVPVALDGKKVAPVELINRLNMFGSRHGVGRVDMIEDRLVGIKSREIYEAPAGEVLNAAHTSLEEMVLDRETRKFKELVGQKYSELVYNGLWFTPLREALDAFVERTQKVANGEVKLKLYKGNVDVVARRSPDSKYRLNLATYSEGDEFDQSLAKGFIDLWSMPYTE